MNATTPASDVTAARPGTLGLPPCPAVPKDLEVVEPQGLPVETETDFAIGMLSLLAGYDLELVYRERRNPYESVVVLRGDNGGEIATGKDDFDALDNALGELP